MRRVLLILLVALGIGNVSWGQNNPTIRFVSTNPSGSCGSTSALQYNYVTGQISGCVGGTWAVVSSTGGTGTVTSVIAAGTANQITATGTCTITTTGTCTLSIPSAFIIPGTINKLTLTSPATGATLTLADGSTLATSGANSITLTSTGATNVTLPTSGTLVNSVVTTLSSLVSVGTITTGTWSATTIALNKGGTGQTTQQAAYDALAPTATRAGDITYWNGTHYVNLAGNNSGTNCFQEDASGVPTWAACSGGGTTYTAGNGLTLTGTVFSINTAITMDLPSSQTVAGVKSFNANTLILTPGADSGTTAGMVNIDASGNLDWYSSGRIYAARNPMTTAGDSIVCSATATPCVPVRLAIGSLGTFRYSNGSAESWRTPLFSDLSGSASSAQIPAVPLTAGTSVTLSENNRYFVCTGTCTVTVPVPAAGVQYCVYNDNNIATVITLAAIGSSARYENTARTAYGTAGTGTFVSGGAVKDSVCIVGRDTTHYSTLSFNGTWTAN